MEKKQSSVEWFFEVLALNDIIDHNRLSDDENLYNLLYRLKKQAKAMHKQEYIDAWMNGQNDSGYSQKELRQMAEADYNETFKAE